MDLKSRNMRSYMLDENRNAVSLTDGEWIEWIKKHHKRPQETVARTIVESKHGPVEVVTSFIGMDINMTVDFPNPEPHVFETIVFGTATRVHEKYSTWDQAEKGHAAICETLKKEQS